MTSNPPQNAQMHAMEIAMQNAQPCMRQVTLPRPVPLAHEVQIRIHYVGVNRADALQLAGKYPPPEGASPLPGLEVSGTISALGENVMDWQVGDPVCALLSGGGYAEYATVPEAQLLKISNGLKLREAAALPEAAATGFMALAMEAKFQPGERVLLHGGASGVGIIMAQIAKCWGAEMVLATVGSPEKCDILQSLGITPINHRTAPFAEQVMQKTGGEGVDIIIDILGGPQFATHLKLLRRGGRLVSLAMLEGPLVESAKLSPILLKHLHISGTTLRSKTASEKAEIIRGVREIVWPHLASGALRPIIDRIFPLLDAEKALTHMQERLHLGKILLEVAEE